MDGQWESDDVERLVYELLRIEDLTKELRIIFIALRDCNMGGPCCSYTFYLLKSHKLTGVNEYICIYIYING